MEPLNRTSPAGATRVAIIGGGIAGLTAAYDLARQGGYALTVYEGNPFLGGLAAGFKGHSTWEWPLEHFYHHLFTNDDAIIGLTRELGLSHLLEIHAPVTAFHIQGKNYPLDSPLRVLQFPLLPLVDRLRMGMVIAYLRYHPLRPWRQFDQLVADEWLARWMGEKAYNTLWQPMLQGKFGEHYQDVNLAWFWARIYKRTPKLGYYRGGFQAFVDGLVDVVQRQGATVQTNARVQQIRPNEGGGLVVEVAGQAPAIYDVVLSTVGPGLMRQLVPDMPASYLGQLAALRSMGAVVTTVALKRQLMPGTYWANISKREGLPFLALVEHTNMIDPAHYGGDHLIYLGDYLDPDHRYFEMDVDALLAEFVPHLTKFNPDFHPDWISGAWTHKAKYAQPVPPVGYAAMIPDLRTPLPGLYFASMSQVYPWDRGTNYAVEIGRDVAKMIVEDVRAGMVQPANDQLATQVTT
ncbi:MAG: NAD(P)/FAD-dependent oxidoreductase [Caldilineaceae bacterium]|nr:NAD(P)/FAD-dependent oxidoreductase [Caldilineaceae bacterium]